MVYKVRHVDHKTILALKVLPSYLLENEEMVSRFNREALLMTRLHHRNIVRVLGSGHDEELNCHFILMENIQGRTLKQYLRDKGPLPLAEILEIIRQIAKALDYAHSRTPAVIHRDIKPSNIMIEDLTGRAVVLDFGIAKELDDGERTRTRTGLMIGTWKYSSPEQLRHEPLTGSADIYSLGLVMYEMYTGSQFFSGLDERAIIGKLLYEPKENEPQFSRPAPPAFVSLVTKAIAKARDKRYPSISDFLDDLEACWLVLDATITQVLVTPEPASVQSETGRDRLEEIGEQIRKLEQERQLHLVMLTQRQVQEARTQAERTGAPQLVPTEFTEASALEETGAEHLQNQRYAAAQDAYTAALASFMRVNEEAAVLTFRRQIEELQKVVETVRADAEHDEVEQYAAELFASAVVAQERAAEFKRQEKYEQAQQTFNEAKSLFADARDLAYHNVLKGEVETARASAHAAKEAAIRERAQEFSTSLVQEATTTVQQAEVALERDELTQARALYQLAGQKYGQAQQHARSVQRQQEIAKIAESVQWWHQQATGLGVEEDEPDHRQAAAAQTQAEMYVTSGDYTRAEDAYKLAQQLFEELVHNVERTQQQQALQAQTEAREAKAEAEQAEAQQWVGESYSEALAIYEHAERLFAQGSPVQATQEYAKAQQAFITARTLAIQNVLRESAHAAQAQMQTERTAAEQAHAIIWASELWQRALATEQEATSAFQHGDYEKARSFFLAGQEQYAEAAQQSEAEHRRQRQAAMAAADDAQNANKRALAANVPDTNPTYQQARTAEQQAETYASAQEYQSAVQGYGHAVALYEEALRVTERERQQQAVLVARQRMMAEQEAARAVAAEQYTGASWNEAEQMVIEAQQYEVQDLFPTAATQYEYAAQRFKTLREEAILQALQQRAHTAQQQMRTTRDTAIAAEAATLAVAGFLKAKETEATAESAFTAQNWTRAEELFAVAQHQYGEAEAEARAIKQQQRQAAQRARANLQAAQAQARTAAANLDTDPLCIQAREITQRAESLFAKADYVESARQYDHAAQRYEEAARVVVLERQRATAAHAREQMETERATAQQLGAPRWFESMWTQLERDVESARQAEQQEAFREATRLYESITESLFQLQSASQKEQERETAEAAREQLRAAQIAPTELRQWATEMLTHAQEREKEAEQAYQSLAYGRATTLYHEASQLFVRAWQQAEREQQTALQELRQQAEAARQSCRAVQKTPILVNAADNEAEGRDLPLLKQAHDTYRQAEEHLAAQEYEPAARTYADAQAHYEEAARVIRLKNEQTAALRARQHVLSVRAAAERVGAADRFGAAWAEAQLTVQEARQKEEKQQFQDATSLYQRAADQFARLQRDTEQLVAQEAQQVQQRVIATHHQTEQRQQKAEQAEAPRYAQAVYEAGLQQLQEGHRQRASNEWEAAESHFVEAQTLFVQSAKLAQRQKAQLSAEPIRKKSQALYTEMQQSRAQSVFPEKWAEAATLLTVAEQAWTKEEFALAQKTFDQACRLLQRLTQDLLRYDQRDQAEQAKATAQSWQQKVGDTPGKQQRDARRAFTAAERTFQQGKYPDAQTQYEKAGLLWKTLFEQRMLSETVPVPAPPPTTEATVVIPPSVPKRLQLLQGKVPYALLGAVLLLLIALYSPNWFHPAREEEQDSQPSQTEKIEKPVASIPPLSIVSQIPEPTGKFVLKEGEQQRFAIQVASSSNSALRYVWRLNGKEQSTSENTWVYSPSFEEGSNNVQTVEVTVSDSDNHTVNQQWQGHVQNVDRPPQIKTATPRPGPTNIDANAVQRFTVEAMDPDRDDRLAIAWFLDGQKVADDKRWDFRAPASEETHEVTVEVSDAEGLKTQLAWNIAVHGDVPLALTRVLPDPVQRLAVEEGKSLPFTVAVQGGGKGPRRYVWQLDGKSQRGDGETWTYQPSYEDGGEKPKTVEVIVSDSANHRVQQRWQVNVQNVNRPPQIQSVTPRANTLEMTANATQDFAVDARDRDRDDRLTYVWSVNGQEVTQEKRWQFRAPTTPGSYTIAAEVSDLAGEKQRQVWEVLVKAVIPPPQPPVWKLTVPQEGKLKVQAGQPRDFSVTAEITGGEKDEKIELQYFWTVNGETQPVRDGQFRLLETTRPGTYEVAVVAIGPQGLKSVPKRWTVEIQSPPPPPSVLLSEAEVQKWLEMYRRAFEEKNTSKLVQLGTHTQAQADALAQVLRVYRSYRVAVRDVSIQCDGKLATLTFKRRDTMEGETMDTDTITFGLEKSRDGRIIVIRR